METLRIEIPKVRYESHRMFGNSRPRNITVLKILNFKTECLCGRIYLPAAFTQCLWQSFFYITGVSVGNSKQRLNVVWNLDARHVYTG